jgi:hypothetical protein
LINPRPEQIDIPPIVDSKSYSSVDYPLAPRGQRVRREQVNANLAGVAVAAQHRVAEIFQPRMPPIMRISDPLGADLPFVDPVKYRKW